jgi:two-component system sensor histidine kinase RpfC
MRLFAKSSRRLAALAAPAGALFDYRPENNEQAVTLNRIMLAMLVLIGAAAHAHAGSKAALAFFRQGLPFLQFYLLLTALLQAHIFWRPGPCVPRRLLAICIDTAILSFGLRQGGAASAYLFPLYFWMILGNGVRFGAPFMMAAVVSAAAGFAVTVASTPFWRDNPAVSVGFFLSLIVIPIYGGLLLRRLAEAHAEAERANHAKTLLLACVSHELRTPLTAILGLGDLLQATALDDEQRQMVQTMSGAGAILLRHIEALLTVSRDEAGPSPARPERVDLFALLVSLRALLAVEADRKGVRLGLCIDCDTPRHILADPALLLDVLQNLAGNAIKFTARGAVAIHVGVVRRDLARVNLRIRVRDSGIGIEKAAQRRIFDSFVQAHPEISRRFGGSGLGLAIAQRRLEARGGRIGVESEAGKGALFWFELAVGLDREARPPYFRDDLDLAPMHRAKRSPPIHRPQVIEPVCVTATKSFDDLGLARRFAVVALARDDEPASWAGARAMAAQLKEIGADPSRGAALDQRPMKRRDPLKILLAEDNGVNRMVLDKILTRAGHATIAVGDGEAALGAMLDGAFDVILLDVNLPGISGPEAARLYQFALPAERRAPILALTADAGAARREQCERAGMVDVLIKPVTPEVLLDAVAAATRKKALVRDDKAAPSPPGDAGEILDQAALAALADLGGESFLRQLIRQFLREGARIVERLANAVEIGDFAAFEQEAHGLESSAGNIGAARLARLCRDWRGAGPGRIALHREDFLCDLSREWSDLAKAIDENWTAGAARRNVAAA